MIQLTASCPTLAGTLTFDSFAATRSGRALGGPLELRFLPGTVLGVVGPNGVGKSSLLSALAHSGVERVGTAKRGERDLSRMSASDRASFVSLLAQDVNAPEELRAQELVAIGARAAKREDPTQAAKEALAEMGIADLAKRRFGTLSGGQKQLVQLARVLAQNTPIVILDEPTSALDLYHQRIVEKTMRKLGDDGKIVIAALHDLSLALNACTQILLLSNDGESYAGSPEDVLRPELVHAAYGVQTSIHTTPQGRRFLSTD